MRAVVHTKYGDPDVLHLAEVDRPTPRADEVLIRVVATTVNQTDCGFRSGAPIIVRYFSGFRRPKKEILGSELAGVVEAVGDAVTKFAVGDEVFGVNAFAFGAHAEYVCMRETAPLAKKPAGMTFDEAAAVCDGVVLSLSCLRAAGVGEGTRLAVYGASGSIGTAAVQLAKHLGAHVTAICNTKNVDTVKALGADEVIDYTKDDFTRQGERFDVIYDAVGKHNFRRCRRALVRGGSLVETDLGFLWQNPVLALVTKRVGSRKLLFPIPNYTQADVEYLKDLIEAGEYRAVIDRRYPLEDVVEATKYVETRQKTGNVVLTVAH